MNKAVWMGIAKDWLLALGITLAVFFVWGFVSGSGSTVEAGGEAPPFALTSLEGESFDSASLQGEVTIINFWATWCGPCREEFPAFAEYHSEHPDVGMLGISVDEDKPAAYVGNIAKKLGATWPILLDPAGEASGPYGIDILPTTVIVDPHGHISAVHVGKATKRQLEQLVAQAAH